MRLLADELPLTAVFRAINTSCFLVSGMHSSNTSLRDFRGSYAFQDED